MAIRKKVLLQDIASATGANVSTVSIVLNGRARERRISAGLEQKILDTARQLHYKPNVLAQSLRSGKSHILGLILPDMSNPTFSRLGRTIDELAAKNGYRIMSCNSDEEDRHPEKLIGSLIDYQVDGFIIAPTTRMKRSLFRMIENSRTPFVLVDRSLPHIRTCQVTMDNFQLGFLSTEHLIRQGFERISIFLAPLNLNHMKDRLAGYRAAMKEYRKQVCPGFIEIIPCREPYAATCAAVDRLLTLQPPVEGAVFMSNTIALPALEHLQAKRIAIPDVLGIVSMEAAPYFSLMHPSVSAVDLNIGRLAERSFEMLMKLIHGDEPLTAPAVETIPVSLIPRESSLRREKERNFSGKP